MTPELLGHPGVRVRVFTERPHATHASGAAAARDGKWNDDAVADAQVLHVGADFDHLAHELVTEDIAALEARDERVVKMQIGAANGGARHLYDGVARIEDLRIGD